MNKFVLHLNNTSRIEFVLWIIGACKMQNKSLCFKFVTVVCFFHFIMYKILSYIYNYYNITFNSSAFIVYVFNYLYFFLFVKKLYISYKKAYKLGCLVCTCSIEICERVRNKMEIIALGKFVKWRNEKYLQKSFL